MYFMAPCSAVPRLLFTLDSTWAVKDVVETVVTTVNTAAIATGDRKKSCKGYGAAHRLGLGTGLGGRDLLLS